MPYTAGLAADLLPDRYGVVLVPHRHTRRFVRPIKETGKRPRPDRMGLGLFFCKVCRKIMPPGGARVLKSAHHDAAVVFGGIIKSKRPRKKSRGRFCIIGRLSFVQPLSLLRRQGRVAAPSVCCAVARILLAAAPTATPCFHRWRRSSPLPLVGEPLAKRRSFTKCQGLPSVGEVASRSDDGEV